MRILTALILALSAMQTSADSISASEVTSSVRSHRQANEQQIVDDFIRLLSMPNVATNADDVRTNAEFIAEYLGQRGVATRLLESPGSPPAVYGEIGPEDADITLLIYVHYDGQPVQEENWASDPWTPLIRDGRVEDGATKVKATAPFDPEWRIYARSAGDDKAPIIALAHALDALKASDIPLSVRLKLFFEGEEEQGSPHLREMLAAHKDLLAADLWLFCDGPMHPTRQPQLVYGVRGTLGFELTVYGPSRPLHSGHYGNWSPNPISMLSHLLASMRDNAGQVLIEGFYDEVVHPTLEELEAVEAAPRVDKDLAHDLGLGRTEGNGQRVEAAILRPALNFRGIHSGSVGDKARNVIPTTAVASVGIRRVPEQTTEQLKQVVEAHIRAQGYHIVSETPDKETLLAHPKVVQVRWGTGGYPAYRANMSMPLAQKIAALLNDWSDGKLIQQPSFGGSLPIYLIEEVIGAPVLILPVANHDNNQHGKDENLRLQNLWDAIEVYALVLTQLKR